MQGLLADVNVEGHVHFLRHVLESHGLWIILVEINLQFATFRDLQLPGDIDDRALWNRCQQDGWVLFTENRNDDGPDSLEATLRDSWLPGDLPVLTLANKSKFERDPRYVDRVADAVADLLFGIAGEQQYRDQPRIFVPR
jgi:hypothetical protein